MFFIEYFENQTEGVLEFSYIVFTEISKDALPNINQLDTRNWQNYKDMTIENLANTWI